MIPQTPPQYADVTSVPNPTISKTLIDRYGTQNVIWPIILIKDNAILAYLYEKTKYNQINGPDDNRPSSGSGVPTYFIDYTTEPRRVVPHWDALEPLMDERYECSYDYIVDSPYSTVDIDYAWQSPTGWRGIEVTTFHQEFTDLGRVESLVTTFNRRPSWQGPEGPHAMHKIVEAAKDLQVDMRILCVNTIAGVSNRYKTDGNAYKFPLSHAQIDRMVQGEVPRDGVFSSFGRLLAAL